MMKVDKDKVES